MYYEHLETFGRYYVRTYAFILLPIIVFPTKDLERSIQIFSNLYSYIFVSHRSQKYMPLFNLFQEFEV